MRKREPTEPQLYDVTTMTVRRSELQGYLRAEAGTRGTTEVQLYGSVTTMTARRAELHGHLSAEAGTHGTTTV